MLDALVGLFTGIGTGGLSAIAGGLTGFIGSFFQRRHELELKRLDLEEKKSERQHDLDLMDREVQNALKLSEAKLDEIALAGENEGMKASLAADLAGAAYSAAWKDKLGSGKLGSGLAAVIAFLLGCVDVARGAVRPVITVYLVVKTMQIWEDVLKIGGGMQGLGQEVCRALALSIVNMILYLTCTAVGWWFGTRGSAVVKKLISAK